MNDRAGVARGPLVVVTGLPGSGKSTLARGLASSLRGCVLSSDTVRRELGLLGTYDTASIRRVYDELLRRAALALGSGPVVVDATFADRAFRDAAIRTAAEAGAPWHLVLMRCDPEVARRRVQERRGESEAGPAVLDLLRDAFDPVSLPHLVLDSTAMGPLELVALAERYVRTRAGSRVARS